MRRSTLARTDAGHIAGVGSGDARSSQPQRNGGYEIRPTGNAVNLEDEMLKVAANQMDYQAATALYSRSLGLIKTALGKRIGRRRRRGFPEIDRHRGLRPARAGRPHARHLREHRQRRFDRADAGADPYRRKIPTFSTELDRALDARVVGSAGCGTDQSNFRLEISSPAIRPPTPTAT